ncbi:MAG TPA: hypothetical protein VFT55_12585 [Planctomycetota bacterium]|nr:hypothetical protein [Planctomycetota bacterium]
MRGSSCYTWGALLYVVSGGLHAYAQFQPPPENIASLHDEMQKATTTFAGMTFSVEGAVHCLSWYLTTFSVMVGLMGLVLRGRARYDAWLLRRLSALFALGAGVLAGFAFHYGIAPPAVLYSITAVLFAAALVRARRPAGATQA